MCGFIGAINTNLSKEKFFNSLNTLEKRGPDDFGVFINKDIFLGHQRLCIMDKSSNSAQPMQYKNLIMVFNGAIYNYQEIKNELIKEGYSFFSNVGDSEVILKAFDRWGLDSVKKFNGMFAFAIYDKRTQKLYMARDRLGIKPFYYSFDGKRFIFGSNMQSILTFSGIDTSINREALYHYMSFHSVVAPPHTIINGVKKLLQSTTAIFDLKTNKLSINEPYWKLGVSSEPLLTYEEYKEELKSKLISSISKRLIADTDVGVLLSGGVDSSLLTAIAKEFKPELHTYSIGFTSTDEERGDEFEFSDIIADKFNTNHHKIFIESPRILKHLPKAIASMSEPMISHDAIGFYLISEEVSRTIKVVQSGQGADEVFGGYHWYPKVADFKGNIVSAYQNFFFDRSFEEMKKLLNPEFIVNDYASEYLRDFFKDKNLSNIDASLFVDTNLFLVDDPVKRVDNMTMSWGLEARVPFLDHELVEFAFSIPAKYKYVGGKKILKDVARDFLPNEVIDRKKGYFPMPLLKYIKGDFLDFMRDKLDSLKAKQRGLFNSREIDNMLKNPNEYITKLNTNSLWQVAVLEIWLQENNI